MTTERLELYNALEKAIGPAPARTLMDRILEPNDQATKGDVADLRQEMVAGFQQVDKRLDKVDMRLDKVDQRLDNVDQRLDNVDQRLDRVDERLSSIDKRLDKIDGQFDKLDSRFEKVDDRLFQFHETLRGYSRTFVTTQAASIVGAVGLAVALIKLL